MDGDELQNPEAWKLAPGLRKSAPNLELERPNVLGLPAFGSFSDLKFHALTFLQAAETARLDGREMHENVFATLAADKAIALGVVEPLHCSLFHISSCVTFRCIYAGREFGGAVQD